MGNRCGTLASIVLIVLIAQSTAASAIDRERARALETLVRQDCGSCHGMTLKGGLGPDLRPARLASVPQEKLARLILDGVPGTAMPPWRSLLSDEDALWIASYLKEATE
jgi:cytochrome c55X